MICDSFSVKGKDHHISQDYTIHGMRDDMAFIIVSDGCSSSENSDIGARLIALSARESLFTANNLNYQEFGLDIIDRVDYANRIFPHVNYNAFDATLLIAWIKDGNVTCYIYGDGIFIHCHENERYITHVKLTSGAPDYLSYFLDDNRYIAYCNINNNNKEININGEVIIQEPFSPVIINRQVSSGDKISILTDGIMSYRKLDNSMIEWSSLVSDFTDCYNPVGEFVKRRIITFEKQCKKENIVHTDDISIASIIV